MVASEPVQTLTSDEVKRFAELGHLEPIPLFSEDECAALRRALRSAPPPLEWIKGQAPTSAAYFAIGSHPAIVERVAALIGGDVMLWGASLLKRRPGQVHPWHTDVETAAPEDGTVSVWIGLKNTDADSSLDVVSRSHRFGVSVQDQTQREGRNREGVTTADIAGWAQRFDAGSEVRRLVAQDGEAVFFDGRLWHGSHNTSGENTRTALLLQYARPDRAMFIPDPGKPEYQLRTLDERRAPCVMVKGTADGSENRILPGGAEPETQPSAAVAGWVKSLDRPLAADDAAGWRRHKIFRGETPAMPYLESHASVLSPGHMPHEPHDHAEDELLVMLDGEADLIIEDEDDRRRERVRRGDFAYYPTGRQRHSIDCVSQSPASYLMLKWSGAANGTSKQMLPCGVYRLDALTDAFGPERENGFATAEVFGGPSPHLRRLKCHLSRVQPGGGYEPHEDEYDVALVILEGEVETLGKRCGPDSVIFYPANQPHGLTNTGDAPALYLVFEFHPIRRQ